MSGTSADGVDVAVVRIATGKSATRPKLTLLAHEHFAYPAPLRRSVLAAMNAQSTSTAELARLNWRLGLAYAEAVNETSKEHKLQLDLVGCHGQTLYHQARASPVSGRKFACTWQAGEAQAIAAELRVPVVSNFRPADMLSGGQGAPLVPLLDYVLFADAKRGRVLQNIGGIANLTAIPAEGPPHEVVAFDTGPGNMVIDWLAQKLFDKPFDRNGALAARGTCDCACAARRAAQSVFPAARPRPRDANSSGSAYAADFLVECLAAHPKSDTMRSPRRRPDSRDDRAELRTRYVEPRMKSRAVDFIVSGGGARNRNADEDAGRAAGTAGMRRCDERRLRIACGSQRSGGVCAARVAHVASPAGQHPRGNRSQARCDPGTGDLCVRRIDTPSDAHPAADPSAAITFRKSYLSGNGRAGAALNRDGVEQRRMHVAQFFLAHLCYHKDDCGSRRQADFPLS